MRNHILLVLCLVAFLPNSKAGTSSTLKDQSLCGDGWTLFAAQKCVKIINNLLQTWEDAANECRILKTQPVAHLLTIKTKEEQELLTTFLFVENEVIDNVWLGLRKTERDGSFEWVDGSELTFHNWINQTHINYRHECGEVRASDGMVSAGQWLKVNCKKKNVVVCEKQPTWTLETMQNVLQQLTAEQERKEKQWKLKHEELKKEMLEEMQNLSKEIEEVAKKCCKQSEQSLTTQKPGTTTPTPCDSTLYKSSNCLELQKKGCTSSGVYTIYPRTKTIFSHFKVYCDMETDGGGWTVFQRRAPADVHINFTRSWNEYKAGFGDLMGEFWLGNDFLHVLTSQDQVKLRIDLEAAPGKASYATYDQFQVGDVKDYYRLKVGGFTGATTTVPGDSFTYHNGSIFATYDKDTKERRCANTYKGAWWYLTCHYSNLNGRYLNGYHVSHADGINWFHWTGNEYSLIKTEMKIKPIN